MSTTIEAKRKFLALELTPEIIGAVERHRNQLTKLEQRPVTKREIFTKAITEYLARAGVAVG